MSRQAAGVRRPPPPWLHRRGKAGLVQEVRASLACGSQNLVSRNAEKPSFKYSEDFIFMEAFCFFLDQLIQCVIGRASVTGEGSAVVHGGSLPDLTVDILCSEGW